MRTVLTALALAWAVMLGAPETVSAGGCVWVWVCDDAGTNCVWQWQCS